MEDHRSAFPLMQILGGYYGLWVLHAAARMGVADILAGGPKAVADIAAQCDGSHLESMTRFLFALEATGMVRRTPDGDRFELTEAGYWLRSDVEGGLKASALMGGDTAFFKAWTSLPEAIRTGRPSFELANGLPFFEHLDGHPDVLANFQTAMTGFGSINSELLEMFDFGARRCVLDIGGGKGRLVTAIVEAHPEVQGWVLDRASVIESLEKSGEKDERIRWIPGDFLESIPRGADTHVLRFVLSDWNDADIVRIFTHCREALPEDGRLLIVDNLHPRDEPQRMAMLDMSMLVLTGGRVRTSEEYVALLAVAGLAHRRTIVTPTRVTMVVAGPRGSGAP